MWCEHDKDILDVKSLGNQSINDVLLSKYQSRDELTKLIDEDMVSDNNRLYSLMNIFLSKVYIFLQLQAEDVGPDILWLLFINQLNWTLMTILKRYTGD